MIATTSTLVAGDATLAIFRVLVWCLGRGVARSPSALVLGGCES